MKNNIFNTLGYTGIVTVSQRIGNRKIEMFKTYNSGGNSLFTYLADCLIGDYKIAEVNQPKKIMLLKYNEADKTYESASGFIYYTSKPEKVYMEAGSAVRYSFIVPKTLLEDSEFNALGLYSNAVTEQNFTNFAAVALVDLTTADVADSAILVIDWLLTFSNSPKKIRY